MNKYEENKKGIVLNRMYTGSYLSTNLGHEVINMFQADNGNHYLYLNARGNFAKEHTNQISDMLLVRYARDNRVEVLAWANGLHEIDGANETYREFEKDYSIFNKQKDFIKEISYGDANLIELFEGSAQQNIYITYSADNFYLPQKPIYIKYVDESNLLYADENDKDSENCNKKDNDSLEISLSGYQFGKATLKQYIYPTTHKNSKYKFDKRKINEEFKAKKGPKKDDEFISELEKLVNKKRSADWDILLKLLNPKDETIWKKVKEEEDKITKENINSYQPREVSLFDIVPKLQRDENCFSDILKHFMNRDKMDWKGILENLCENTNIGEIREIVREKDATIVKKKTETDTSDSNGGRIDILIRTDNAYIVIENKIKSDINSKKSDGVDGNQLKRYRDYVKYCIIGDYINNLTDGKEKEELGNSYKDITPSDLPNFEDSVKVVYEKNGKPLPEIKEYFFVLAPDYNMPDKRLLEKHGYKALYYSALVGKDNGVNDPEVVKLMKDYNKHQNDDLWSAFYEAMKRHSYSTENQSLYEDMKSTFFTRIKEIRSKKVNNA